MPENFAETHRNVTFNNNVTATLRQEPGTLYPRVGSSASYTGSKSARIENRFGRIKFAPKRERNGDTNNTDMTSVARFIKVGGSQNGAPLIDRDDIDVTSVELKSPAVTEVAEAARTYHDDRFGLGYFGNGWEGENGDAAVAFKATNVLVHGGATLNLAKLLAVAELAKTRNCKLMREPLCMLLMPKDETALLSIEEYKNSRYSGATPLVEGEIKPFMGIRFFPFNPDVESLPESYGNFFSGGGTVRRLPVFQPSGLHRGIWTEFFGKIEQLGSKAYSWQIYGEARSAIVRTDEDKCFIVETTG